LAPFLEKTSLDRAPGRFADNLFVPKHAKADVLLTTVLGPLRSVREWHGHSGHRTGYATMQHVNSGRAPQQR